MPRPFERIIPRPPFLRTPPPVIPRIPRRRRPRVPFDLGEAAFEPRNGRYPGVAQWENDGHAVTYDLHAQQVALGEAPVDFEPGETFRIALWRESPAAPHRRRIGDVTISVERGGARLDARKPLSRRPLR